ncbi:MAG: hypothetical protein Tsb0013_04460 [Phycisphaerales bacterium]
MRRISTAFFTLATLHSCAHAQLDAPWLTPIVIPGQTIIDPGTTVENVYWFDLRSREIGAFVLRLGGDENQDALVVRDTTGFRIIAQRADPVPGGSPTDGLRLPTNGQFYANAQGHVAFSSRIIPSPPQSPPPSGIFLFNGEGLESVTLVGRPAPGTSGEFVVGLSEYGTFEHFDLLGLSDEGELAFRAFIDGEGIDDTNNQGVWRGPSSDLRLVLRLGSHAPGTDGNFSSIERAFDLPVESAGANLVIHAATDDEDSPFGIWVHDGERLIPRVIVGGSMPGPYEFEWFNEPEVNHRGQYAFRAIARDSEGRRIEGIWVDKGDGPVLVRDTTQPLEGFDAAVEHTFGPRIGPNGEVGYVLSMRAGVGVPSRTFAAAVVHDGSTERVLSVQHRPAPLSEGIISTMSAPGFCADGRPIWSIQVGDNSASGRIIYVLSDTGEPRVFQRDDICLDINPDPFVQDNRSFTGLYRDSSLVVDAILARVTPDLSSSRGLYSVDFAAFSRGCIADLDDDGDVDAADFSLFGARFGNQECRCDNSCLGDFDGDGQVELGDFGIFASEFGRTDCFDN